MTFLWVWAYGLRGPITYLCMAGLFICFVMFVHAMKQNSQNRSGTYSLGSVHAAVIIGFIWALFYAMPAPEFDKTVVYKDRVVEKPVVKKVVAVTRTITKTITKYPDRNNNVAWCNNNTQHDIDWCTNWAIKMEQPRIIVRNIIQKVPVYSGTKVVQIFPSRNQNISWCVGKRGDGYIEECTDWAIKLEKPNVIVKVVKPAYMDVYKWCNENYSLNGIKDAEAGKLRNERLAICADVALKLGQK